MGFPATGAVDVPGTDHDLAGVVTSALTDPDGVAAELSDGLRGGPARPGHLCVNSWVFTHALDAVLLIQHPRFGWTVPGGHLDVGETPHHGAARELTEETGITATPACPVPVAVVGTLIPPVGAHPAHMHYTLSYAFLADRGAELTTEAGQPAAWFDLDATLPEGFFGDNWHAHRHVAALADRS